jgi:hypothetical protein
VVFVAVPRWRYLSRWPAALSAAAAFGSVWVARFSGDSFLGTKPELEQLVESHESRGNQLSWLMVLFLVVVVVAVWSLGGPSGLASGRGAQRARVAVLERVMPVAVVVASLLVLVWVVLTGDSGARAVWG